MELLELNVENFLSFESANLWLKNAGVVLVSGENGAGKSSLTSKAICYALFGETARGTKGDSVVNVAEPTKHTHVSLRFKVGSEQHEIVRERNPALLSLDGVSHRVPAETQRMIERLIGRDLESFLSTDYFGQDRGTDFLGLSSSGQVTALENILRLCRLDAVVEEAKKQAHEEQAELEAISAATVRSEGRLAQTEQQLHSFTRRMEELEVREDRRITDRKSLDTLETAKRREMLNMSLDKMQDHLRGCEDNIRQYRDALRVVEGQKDKAEQRLALASERVRLLKSQFRKIEDEICPVCSGPVNAELTQKLREQQASIEGHHAAHLADQHGAEMNLRTLKERADHILSKLNEAKLEHATTEQRLFSFEEMAQSIQNRRDQLQKEEIQDQAVRQELERSIEQLYEWISGARQNAELNRDNANAVMKRLSMLNYWIEVFGKTFRNFILEQALPFLQERTEYHLRLLNNPQLKVNFSTQRVLKSGEERHQLTVTASRSEGGSSEMMLSGGERQMASFAVGLALSELADSQGGTPSNVMILDEPFTYLDQENVEAVIHYVTTELVKRKATILLISNDERMKSLLPGGVHVERGADGESRGSRATGRLAEG